MVEEVHPESGLAKGVWTDADFQTMGWHDSHIYAISLLEYEDETLPPTRLLLDLDYIVQWVDGQPPARHFTFWVAPATLVFDQAWNVTGEFGPLSGALEVADLHRLPPEDDHPDWLWHIEGHQFDLRLRAPGYTQHMRRPPLHVARQRLTLAERGGISVAEEAFA